MAGNEPNQHDDSNVNTFVRAKKKDPTNYVAKMGRGVPEGALLSPVLFNMYVDILATNIVAKSSARNGNSAVVYSRATSSSGPARYHNCRKSSTL